MSEPYNKIKYIYDYHTSGGLYPEKQELKFKEELAELLAAIYRFEHKRNSGAVLEELADVFIMYQQVKKQTLSDTSNILVTMIKVEADDKYNGWLDTVEDWQYALQRKYAITFHDFKMMLKHKLNREINRINSKKLLEG